MINYHMAFKKYKYHYKCYDIKICIITYVCIKGVKETNSGEQAFL